MPVAATGYESQVCAAIVGMVANCASWRTLVGASTADQAKGFIVEENSARDEAATKQAAVGDLDETQPMAVVRSLGVDTETVGYLTYQRNGTAEVFLRLPLTDGDTPAEDFRRLRNLSWSVVAEMEAQFGTSGALVAGEISAGETAFGDPTKSNRKTILCVLTIRWSDRP